jgi:pre-mRNA-splicing factor CDC5/CEF1
MDDDEKEMLSEARARLANTKGKKAKRIAREKMLEDAKRIATMQKLRELKAAGIDINKRRRKRSDGIDYAREVPFEKHAPAGFFDTSGDDTRRLLERAAETDGFKMTLLNKLEKERAEEVEARERRADKSRMKRMMQKDLPAVLAAEVDKDPMAVRKRSKLTLPAPVLSDAELEEAVKMGSGGPLLEDEDEFGNAYEGSGTVVTAALLGDYQSVTGTAAVLAARHAALGMNVPTSTARRDAIMEEARNLAAITAMPTPLFGGENVDLEQGTGFSGSTPLTVRGTASKPDVGATPMRGTGLNLPTPVRGSGASVVGSMAPVSGPSFRDVMGLNDDEAFSVAGSEFGASRSVGAMSMRTGGLGARSIAPRHVADSVALSLASLPTPKYAYDILPPDISDDFDESSGPSRGSSASVIDQGFLDAERRAQEESQALRELARRSSVLKHSPALPRPLVIDDEALAPPASQLLQSLNRRYPVSVSEPLWKSLEEAESLVRDEMTALLKADAAKYPVGCIVMCLCVRDSLVGRRCETGARGFTKACA